MTDTVRHRIWFGNTVGYLGCYLSSGVMLPPLQAAIVGKSEKEAANILLNFVQTGFTYQTDDEQFGYEKPFFVDELFYYPACDCEDRSVLFSYLVRTLIGLDVVLLDYPNPIATAVCFNEDVKGGYVTLNGKPYIICDPTFIHASIGRSMPHYKNAQVEVIRFNCINWHLLVKLFIFVKCKKQELLGSR